MLYTLIFPYVEIYCSECIFWTSVFTCFNAGDVFLQAKFLGNVEISHNITQYYMQQDKRHSCKYNKLLMLSIPMC